MYLVGQDCQKNKYEGGMKTSQVCQECQSGQDDCKSKSRTILG